MERVGFIGLGTMGLPMAKNLKKAGFDLCVHARRPEPVKEMTALGARSLPSPKEVGQNSDIVITIVTADPQVDEVILGENGLLWGMKEGGIIVDMSTISPMTIRKISKTASERDIKVVDAPVSGGDVGAEAGTLTIIAGGDKEDVERCRPLFEAMGENIFHVGGVGTGQIVKIVNQLIGGITMAAIGEGLVLGAKAGADPKVMRQVISVSSGNSALFQARVAGFLLEDHFQPGFMLDLMKKDVGLAMAMGKEMDIPMPLGSIAYELYAAASAMDLGTKDFSAVCKVLEKMARTHIVKRE